MFRHPRLWKPEHNYKDSLGVTQDPLITEFMAFYKEIDQVNSNKIHSSQESTTH